MTAPEPIVALRAAIAGCRACAAHLPHGPRPVVQIGEGARLLVIGQAPGSRVHASGVPWDDRSGDRLRDWLGMDGTTFYDPRLVAQVPMGFCYPGAGNGADLPPRRECAPLWHDRVRAALPAVRLTLLIGGHAQARHLGRRRRASMTETVRAAADYLPDHFPLPHPSWRVVGWMRRNPWFEAETLPLLRRAVREACGSSP